MKLIKGVIVLALVAVFATSAFAFMATNSVAESFAGEGQAKVWGYTVTNIHYDISPTDPSLVVGVKFDLAPANAKTVFVKYEPPEGGFVNGMCVRIDSTATWTCPWASPVLLEKLTELEVMAAQ